jgi:hypothetical protein
MDELENYEVRRNIKRIADALDPPTDRYFVPREPPGLILIAVFFGFGFASLGLALFIFKNVSVSKLAWILAALPLLWAYGGIRGGFKAIAERDKSKRKGG